MNAPINTARVRQALLFGALGICFSVVYGFVGYSLSGGGHGSGVFGELVSAPEPFGFLIWPCVGLLLPWRGRCYIAIIIVLLLMVNYIGVVVVFLTNDNYYVVKTAKAVPLTVIFVAGSYVALQLVIATSLVRLLLGKDHYKEQLKQEK